MSVFRVVWELDPKKGLTLDPSDDASIVEFMGWLLRVHAQMKESEKHTTIARLKEAELKDKAGARSK